LMNHVHWPRNSRQSSVGMIHLVLDVWLAGVV
jgi:hypothetical protein